METFGDDHEQAKEHQQHRTGKASKRSSTLPFKSEGTIVSPLAGKVMSKSGYGEGRGVRRHMQAVCQQYHGAEGPSCTISITIIPAGRGDPQPKYRLTRGFF